MLSYLEGTAESQLTNHSPQMVATPGDRVTSEVPQPSIESLPVDQPATSLPQERAMPATTIPSSEPSAEQPDKAALSAELLAIVSERTGYPPDMLKLDLDLEADLGIDSIKRVEILGNFQESLGAVLRQDSEEMMENLAGVKTLGGIIGWIEERLTASAEIDPQSAEPVAAPEAAAEDDKAERLLAIVSERTGYPPEMLKLDLDLEADLGIDSIKRVEILGNFQESLGASAQEAAGEMMEKLAGIKTLGGIIEWIEDRLGAASKTSRDQAVEPPESPSTPGADRAELAPTAIEPDVQDDVQIKRYTLAPVASPLNEQGPGLAKDRVIVVTEDGDGGDDGRGLARTLATELGRRGYSVALVRRGQETREDGDGRYVSALASLEEAGELLELIRRQSGPIGSIVHLHPLTPVPSMEDLDLEAWKDRINAETKSLFYLAKAASAELQEAAATNGACLVAATAMGGAFATTPPTHGADLFPGHGGVHGLLKTLALEWPGVRVKAVDLDPVEATEALADHLCEEMLSGDQLVAIGYNGSGRVALQPVEAPLSQDLSEGVAIDSSSVILVTGGARGVTADTACHLAEKYQPTLVLVGRSPLPAAEESAETAELTEPQELKAALIEALRQTGEAVTPAQIEAAYSRLIKDRDMRAKLAAMKQAGATVDYRQADVRDAEAFGQLIDDVYGAYGRLDGVIHGAGVIEDKLIEDKTPESFDRVFDTKVDSAFLLSRKLRPDGLEFLVLFSSVAGCFGNRGQADYAAANEVLNKLALHLDHHWPARVVAINWGPWATGGMVSAALERQFAERGVALIPRHTGQRLLDEELRYGRKGEAEVVIGGAGWQAPAAAVPVQSSAGLPLIGEATFSRFGANGAEKLIITLDTARDLYLNDHQIDNQPVLPMAMAMELMAEAVAGRFPDLQVVGVQDLKVLQGVVLENGPERVQVVLHDNGTGGGQPGNVRVQIVAGEHSQRVHYQATVEVDHRLPTALSFEPLSGSEMRSFPKQMDEIYRDWLFHGFLFHGIMGIEQIGADGVRASIVASSPDRWLEGSSSGQWLIDPLMIDSGLQLLIVWAREHWDMTPLPSRFRALHRFGTPSSPHMTCEVHIRPNTRGQIIHADLYFLDADGRLIAILEDMEGTCSKALNRLAGGSKLLISA
jgi:NAD(P)-dependent dehydrogenase (short-subunit alcohol dehydrogenase family)/acyl carrier protein